MDYPKAPDKKIQKLSNLLVNYSEQNDLNFSFAEEEIYALETFAHFGALSLFLVEAKEHYEKVYNAIYTVEELMQPFGNKLPQLTPEQEQMEIEYLQRQPRNKIFPIIFEEQDENTYFGFIPRVSESLPFDFSLVAHFAHYSLEEYVKIYKKNKMLLIDGKIPLDPLFEKMSKKVNARQIQIIKPTQIKAGPSISGGLTQEDEK